MSITLHQKVSCDQCGQTRFFEGDVERARLQAWGMDWEYHSGPDHPGHDLCPTCSAELWRKRREAQ